MAGSSFRMRPLERGPARSPLRSLTAGPPVRFALGVHPLQRADPVPHAPAPDRRGASRVGGRHPAERGPLAARGHRRELEAVRTGGGVEGAGGDAGRHVRLPVCGVHLEPGRAERGEVHHDALAHVSAAHGTPGAARHERRAARRRPADQSPEIGYVCGHCHPGGHDPVDTRPLRVRGAGAVIGAKLALQAGSLRHGRNVRPRTAAAKRTAGSPAILVSDVRHRPPPADPHRSGPPTRP